MARPPASSTFGSSYNIISLITMSSYFYINRARLYPYSQPLWNQMYFRNNRGRRFPYSRPGINHAVHEPRPSALPSELRLAPPKNTHSVCWQWQLSGAALDRAGGRGVVGRAARMLQAAADRTPPQTYSDCPTVKVGGWGGGLAQLGN